jgi:hypothetical protein
VVDHFNVGEHSRRPTVRRIPVALQIQSRNAQDGRPNAPSRATVDFDPTLPPVAAPQRAAVSSNRRPVDWRESSFDLQNGLVVRDHSDSIPQDLFERLFQG